MSCTATSDTSELDFVLALHTRTKELGECRGPLLALNLAEDRVFTLAKIFQSRSADDLLWAGHRGEEQRWLGPGMLLFQLCGAHWLDLACLVWMRCQQQDSVEIFMEAEHLMREVCQTAGWDAKEIVNMFQWQRARLT